MLAEKDNYPIKTMASLLEVSRSGYYDWVKRNPTGEDPWAALKETIQDIWEKSKKRFGFRKVHAKLISDHHDRFGNVTRYRVRKCMQELGIRGICPNASKQTTKQAKDAEELAKLNSNTVPVYLASYYFSCGNQSRAFEMLEKYLHYCASDETAWAQSIKILKAYYSSSDSYRDGVVRIIDFYKEWNANNIGTIKLSKSDRVFLNSFGLGKDN